MLCIQKIIYCADRSFYQTTDTRNLEVKVQQLIMHSCKQPIPIMKYGNPVQIGDKVSVAAMGTRGDKRGWEVLPPPNTIQTGCFQGRKHSS